MPGVSEEQRFCVRCGTALAAGRCPLHGSAVSAFNDRLTSSPSVPPSIHNSGLGTEPRWPPPPASVAAWAPPPQPPRPQPQPPPARASIERSSPPRSKGQWSALGIGAVVLIAALLAFTVHLQLALSSNQHALSQVSNRLVTETATANGLAGRIAGLETKVSSAPDAALVARQVQASVFTIDTPDGLGSGWVVGSSGGNSTLITDYHVVATVWTGSGGHTVQVRQEAKSFTGTIVKVDPGDDLALITVKTTLVPLKRAKANPQVGDSVLVVGSPLGLGGTVSSGIVSSIRPDGRIQFSAPISPGDSGGPVVNRFGEVIGVAESKLVGNGVEGLSFAIPISTVCSTVTTC